MWMGNITKVAHKWFKGVGDLSEFDKSFIKNLNEKSKGGYFLEDEIQYPEDLHEFHDDLPFVPERMKIEKSEKLIGNLRDKNEYAIYMINLKQALNNGLVLKKGHRVIKFDQKACLELYIKMNTELRKKAEKD